MHPVVISMMSYNGVDQLQGSSATLFEWKARDGLWLCRWVGFHFHLLFLINSSDISNTWNLNEPLLKRTLIKRTWFNRSISLQEANRFFRPQPDCQHSWTMLNMSKRRNSRDMLLPLRGSFAGFSQIPKFHNRSLLNWSSQVLAVT